MLTDDLHPDDTAIILPKPSGNGFLLEHEIKACWRENMLAAADDAAQLTKVPVRGSTALEGLHYGSLREHLKLAEGACRQMCHWREDARWLYLAPMLEQTHQMALEMLLSKQSRKLFGVLETSLRKLVRDAEDLQDKATGKVGMILPKPLEPPHRDTKPVQVLLQ